jgi:hypothetical protein
MEGDPDWRLPVSDRVAFDQYKEYLDLGEVTGICSNEFQAGIGKRYREWTNTQESSEPGDTQSTKDIIGVVADQFAAIAHEDDESIRRTHKQFIRSLFNVPEVPGNIIPPNLDRAKCCLTAPPLLRRDPGFEQGACRAREWAKTGDPKGICQYADILFLDGQYDAATTLLWTLFNERNEAATSRLADYFLHVDPMPRLQIEKAHHFFDTWAAWPGIRPVEGHVLPEPVLLHALFSLRDGDIQRARGLLKLPPGLTGTQDRQYMAISARLPPEQ